LNEISSSLVVILHADIIGSTELVQRDEKHAHLRITDALRRLADVITSYGGIAHEVRGDALVAEFSKASDAVCAAIAFQISNTELNALLTNNIRPDLRIGVAMGEVIIANATITGSGVVLAQRIEQFSSPGGVNITSAIHEALPRRLPFEITNLGEKELKGFDDSIRIYEVKLNTNASVPAPIVTSTFARFPKNFPIMVGIILLGAISAGLVSYFLPWFKGDNSTLDQSSQVQVQVQKKPSIAVMPFVNMSDSSDQEYFADGMTEDLITDLSKISGLVVIARNSTFVYKGLAIDLRQVSKDLGARYILEGSVRRSGDEVRINAQLIDGRDGGHIWADRYDRKIMDVFALQDEVSQSIVKALSVNLTDIERTRLGNLETTNIEAYEVRLRALQVQARFTREDNIAGRGLYEKAVRIDPHYARAWAGIGLTHAIDINMSWTPNREQSIRQGLIAINRALELDDTVVRAYFAKAAMLQAQGRFDEAEVIGRRVVDLEPNYADGHAQLAFGLANSGKHEESLLEIAKAYQLNPIYSQIYMYVRAIALFMDQRYDEAALLLEQAIERNPSFDRVHVLLASVYGHLGRIDDANWTVTEVLTLRPELTLQRERSNSAYRRSEDKDRYIEGLRMAGFPE
jgi:adenylate cyclase